MTFSAAMSDTPFTSVNTGVQCAMRLLTTSSVAVKKMLTELVSTTQQVSQER